MKRIPFHGHILLLGYGGVGRCTLPLLLKHIDVPGDRITVMDMVDHRKELEPYRARGVRFVRAKIDRTHLESTLAELVSAGDMIIDLAWNIGCTDILSWCHDRGVLYMNTSVEVWDPYENMESALPTERTLYVRHMAIRAMMAQWKDRGATAVLEHGANPGLVSHFTKLALRDIAEILLDRRTRSPEMSAIRKALEHRSWPLLASLLGVKVIHISELDTQRTRLPHDPNVFLNTWSVEGFYEEGTSPAEMGWGTHETRLPEGSCLHENGPKNQICLRKFGIDTYVQSRVPSGEIVGMVVRHGEAFTISDYLTVRDAAGTPVYRPTVHYAYCPCPAAIASLRDLRKQKYEMQEKWRIMGDDIIDGRDELGVLLMGHDLKSWWTGTTLTIDEARRLVPGQNATTLQVAAAVLAAAVWMIEHPHEGILVPDELPFEDILKFATPYLGSLVSQPINWSPTGEADQAEWQFQNFLLPHATESVLEEAHERDRQEKGADAIVHAASTPAAV